MTPGWLDRFACPNCVGTLAGLHDVRCNRCGRLVGKWISERFVDFTSASLSQALTINNWSDDFLHGLSRWAEESLPASDPFAMQLLSHGIVQANGEMTSLGQNIRYHLDEYRWQKGRGGLDGLLDLATIGSTVRVLDVGCGAGQTLRRLDPDRPVELFGVDRDTAALALGRRLAHAEGIQLHLAGASATALPFRDASFDLTITRVALNYVHQKSALAEMVRVLRPGGYLFCRVESFWHDVGLLRDVRGPKTLICRLRDAGWGTIHAFTGWQPAPGSFFRGGRAFASLGRLSRILSRRGCRIVHATESPNGPIQFGRRTQVIVVAQKQA